MDDQDLESAEYLQRRLEYLGIEKLISMIAELTARINELEQSVEFIKYGFKNPA